jgi:hypothetical protein
VPLDLFRALAPGALQPAPAEAAVVE